MKKNGLLLAPLLLALPFVAQAADASKGDPAAGRVKATAICSGCHGVPGIRAAYPEVYSVPKLGNQNEAYLVAALKAYKAGERYNQTMRGLASALSDKEMADIAAFYAQGSVQTAAK